jgi:hypothetical protein
MGRKRCKITAKDIAQYSSLGAFIAELIKNVSDSTGSELQEDAATALRSLAQQSHHEHVDAIFAAGAVRPLIALLRTSASANAQASAAGALAALAHEKPEHQAAIVAGGAIAPLVRILSAGGTKAQEEAASALA